ncbi:MerR family DNA-binding transcriptional regulator [Mycobacterium sp. 21AC1]|uniref:MerR family transcriptional regulator n=1 Tax=[Mycobacterium] appelbergii TaxID=2939269 RepID=UPI00293936FF|nr:MerR family DNA-binding transcriptional regulator [Mycobacterium sp. 21AC1]MDV3125314.1 MerR family DNA-binding transcriptional regulator [Mycobacterium sp. 21AC1]
MKSLNPGLRTADVAQRTGYSVQQIRNLERAGVLPTAPRTASGYRVYSHAHVRSVDAYRAFAAAVGPVDAKRIMRVVQGTASEALELVDEAHAQIHTQRRDLRLAQRAVATIVDEPLDDARPSDSMTISELAGALGVRVSALRHWEAEGLITAGRSAGRVRRYAPRDVRDVRIVHQLRLAGYRIPPLRALMPLLRDGQDWDDVGATLSAREDDLARRSRELLAGAAALHLLLSSTGQSDLTRDGSS